MAEVMEMLALSPTMEEGTLAEWLISEGDSVSEGDILAEIETDKATMEMESFYSGTILKVLAKAGQTVKVGEPLVIIGEPGEDIEGLISGGTKSATPETPAPEKSGQPAGESKGGEQTARGEKTESKISDAPSDDSQRLKASPLARRMAEDSGVELTTISGSGPSGRIIKRDIEAAMQQSVQSAGVAPQGVDVGDVAGHTLSLSQMRKTIARRLTEVWQSTPHFYLTIDIDMANAMAQRKQINEQLNKAGEDWKVSVNDLIIKACANALARYPKMNVAYLGDALYQFEEVNIGVAVAIDDGLITPTVRQADTKGIGSLAKEVRDLATRAKDKKLKPEEYSNHTFSISNLGMYGIDHFSAVINPPDAGILACGAVQKVPVVDERGELSVGTRMKVTLACDHRAVDGATGAEFLGHVKTLLENPVMLLV